MSVDDLIRTSHDVPRRKRAREKGQKNCVQSERARVLGVCRNAFMPGWKTVSSLARTHSWKRPRARQQCLMRSDGSRLGKSPTALPRPPTLIATPKNRGQFCVAKFRRLHCKLAVPPVGKHWPAIGSCNFCFSIIRKRKKSALHFFARVFHASWTHQFYFLRLQILVRLRMALREKSIVRFWDFDQFANPLPWQCKLAAYGHRDLFDGVATGGCAWVRCATSSTVVPEVDRWPSARRG